MVGRKKMSKESGLTATELKEIIAWNQKQLDKIEDADKREEMSKLVGRCFKYRNCYSCPQKPSDYWWLYAKVLSMKPNGNLVVFEFQIDKDGEIRITPRNIVYHEGRFQGWKKISLNQFVNQWTKVLGKIVDLDAKYSYASTKVKV